MHLSSFSIILSFNTALSGKHLQWDVYHTDYSKRDVKEIAYSEIATSLETNIPSIKTKINRLRAQLGKELTKEKNTKSG